MAAKVKSRWRGAAPHNPKPASRVVGQFERANTRETSHEIAKKRLTVSAFSFVYLCVLSGSSVFVSRKLTTTASRFFLTFAFHSPTILPMAITRRQREVYDFISRFVAEHGYSPSFEEIGNGLKLNSLATVHKHITNLEKKGLLTRDYNRSRSIDLLPPKGRLKQAMSVNTGLVLPLLGRIAAGQPIEAVQSNETISLADFVRSKEVFVLEVRGDSMQDEAILDGDYVLVERLKTAHNGDIVVAIIDKDDATLKRFFREGDNIRLQPSNATMKPIIVPAASVEVQGRVIGVLRKY
jgi:repressor LexA